MTHYIPRWFTRPELPIQVLKTETANSADTMAKDCSHTVVHCRKISLYQLALTKCTEILPVNTRGLFTTIFSQISKIQQPINDNVSHVIYRTNNCIQTKRNALLSGFTLCFSMYFTKLQLL